MTNQLDIRTMQAASAPAAAKPQEMDVVCGRGRSTYHHNGNRLFRKIVEQFLERYSNATSKLGKSVVVSDIIVNIRKFGGAFVKFNSSCGTYERVSERIVREKVGQGLRDVLHTQYKSSTGAKRRKRDATKAQYTEQINRIVSQNVNVNAIISDVAYQVNDAESDEECKQLFQSANMRILQDLKDNKCASAMDPSVSG
mmetsp:Transcript_16674/g.27647  ORF Transcript_16674/g.27647 Transcript_16674/m.27647 type:complete len:198 (-) Transcript_16674:628-1221(-)